MTYSSKWDSAAPMHAAKGFKIHLIVFLLAIPVLWIVWYFTDRTYLWPLWSNGAWAIGVLFHYLGVFVFGKSKRT